MRSARDRRDAYNRGRQAEGKVSLALTDSGWDILERNWMGGGGELDIVAMKEGVLRFVEVKSRSAGDSSGVESVTVTKRRRLIRAAQAYLNDVDFEFGEVSFSIASLMGDRLVWVHNAFDCE